MNHALFLRSPKILSHPAQTPEVPHSKDPPLSRMKNYFLLVAVRRRGAIGSERDVTCRRTRLQSLGKSARLSPYCRALMLRSIMVPTGEKPWGVGVSQKLAIANPSPYLYRGSARYRGWWRRASASSPWHLVRPRSSAAPLNNISRNQILD